MTETLEIVAQLLELDLDLTGRTEVLQRAASALSEMRAMRRDPQRRGLKDFAQLRLVVATEALAPQIHNSLARQRARDECGLAGVNHTLAVMGQCVDDAGFRRRGKLPAHCAAVPVGCVVKARRNSR